MRTLLLPLALLLVAADWPQFRGPNGSGVSPDAAPPVTWDDKTNLVWKAPLPGPGSSSPIVVGDRVFVTCYTGEGKTLARHLVCLDKASGKQRWKATVAAHQPEDPATGFLGSEHGYASSTPASDGTRVYCFFGKSGVAAYDLDGTQLWLTGVGTESDPRGWGSAASPVVSNGVVYVNASSESQSVRALDAATGKQKWKAEASRLSLAFGTPAFVTGPGGPELCVAAPGELWGLDPATGKLRWYAGIAPEGNVSPSVVAGDGVAYVTGGFSSKGTVAVTAGGKGDATKGQTRWSVRPSSYVPTPLLHGGRLFWVGDTGTAVCLDAATGKTLFDERVPNSAGKGGRSFYASPILAGGKIYVQSRRAGTFVVEPGATFQVVAQNRLKDDTDFNATPAASDGRLYLRSNAAVYCVGAK